MNIVENEVKLLDFLVLSFPDSPKSRLRTWLKKGRIMVDGSREKSATLPLIPGQTVTFAEKPVPLIEGRLEILFQDQHLVVINKPIGLLTVATAFEQLATAHGILKRHFHPGRIYVVHRLDRETSGAMLFARSDVMCESLKELLKDRVFIREYEALVEGSVTEDYGCWESYLKEGDDYVVRSVLDPKDSKYARTHFTVLNRQDGRTHLRLRLDTGRKNQIRVHCADAGYPIVGDLKYGAKSNPYRRMCLHSSFLSITHPKTGEDLSFSVPQKWAVRREKAQ